VSRLAGLFFAQKMDLNKKLKQLKIDKDRYVNELAHEMKTYRGVIHESASSELKHSKVMVLKDMVRSITQEVEDLEISIKEKEKIL